MVLLPTISLCMIVKNEAENIQLCLDSVKSVVDEIIIVDTGSADKTVEICREYTDKIYFFQWCDDFSAARNESIKYATRDWILILDADEALTPATGKTLKNILQTIPATQELINPILYEIPKADLAAILHGTTSKEVSSYPCHQHTRLIRNHCNYQFKYSLHEMIITHTHAPRSIPTINIVHYGYEPLLDDNLRRKKQERAIACLNNDLQKYPNDPAVKLNFGRTYLFNNDLENFEKVMNEAITLRLAQKESTISLRHIYFVYSQGLIAHQRYTQAVPLIYAWIARLGSSVDLYPHYLLGKVFSLQGKSNEAQKIFTQLQKAYPLLSPQHPYPEELPEISAAFTRGSHE
jgi:glycosyltransferase involved in cell wall biosynthesis